MSRSRHSASLSTPLSTKIVVFLGLALVAGGFVVAGWQRLTASDEIDRAPAPAHSALQYLPDIRTVVVYLGVIFVAVIGGGYVLVRSRRRDSGL